MLLGTCNCECELVEVRGVGREHCTHDFWTASALEGKESVYGTQLGVHYRTKAEGNLLCSITVVIRPTAVGA